MKSEIQTKLTLIKILNDVLEQKRSLTNALPNHLKEIPDPRDKALVQFCAYGIMRDYFRLDAIIKKLTKSLKDKNLYYLLLIGIYQLLSTRIPDYAVIHSTVDTAKKLKLFSATGLVNGVLRQFQRQQSELLTALDADPVTRYSHPAWLIKHLQNAWPQQWEALCTANNEHPPMWLRINKQKISPAAYAELLKNKNIDVTIIDNTACCLTAPIDVTELPGFAEGWVSVQDRAAQLAAELLDLKPGQRVLDACAAPGGKTAHILETEPQLAALVAIDHDAERVSRIFENLQRLQLSAQVITADALEPQQWWDRNLFDRILLDAPCSATGVIRRHPDIKILRQAQDIGRLPQQQLALLKALWPLLQPGGKLLYVTCSVLPQENEMLLGQFCQEHPEAVVLPIEATWGIATAHGRQILPGEKGMDGFFYGILKKG